MPANDPLASSATVGSPTASVTTQFPTATTSAQNPTTITSQTPGYLLPYAQQGAMAAQQMLGTPYTPYTGERVAGPSELALQALGTAAGTSVPGAVGAAPTVTASLLSGLTGTPSSFTDTGIASMYMNPYITNVLNVQQERAKREYEQALRDYGLKAAQRGAFGGSRQALGESALGEGYMRSLNELTAKGLAGAYESAQGQFNREQEAARARTELGFRGAEQLGKQGMQEQAATQNYLDMLTRLGGTEEARRQKQLDIDYQNFLEQRQYPEQQLQKYTATLGVLPRGLVTEQRTAADPFAMILPLLTAAYTGGGGQQGLGELFSKIGGLFGSGSTSTGGGATSGKIGP